MGDQVRPRGGGLSMGYSELLLIKKVNSGVPTFYTILHSQSTGLMLK